MQEVRSGKAHIQSRRENCVEVSSYWKHWPCLFPQHDAGKKFERRIALTEWQPELAHRWPEEILRGLIQSDGYRFTYTGRCNWVSPAVRLLSGIDRHPGHLLQRLRHDGRPLD